MATWATVTTEELTQEGPAGASCKRGPGATSPISKRIAKEIDVVRRSGAVLGLLSIVLLALAPAHARAAGARSERSWYAGKLDFETGFDYRTGDYGNAEDTAIHIIPFSIRYRFQNLGWSERDEIRLRVSVPYLFVKGPERGNASPGGTGTDRGIGDVNLRATYVYRPRPVWIPDVYLSERVKFPTASESKNLGSGEFDFTTDVVLLKQISLRRDRYRQEILPFRYVKPYLMVGYKVVGDPSAEDRDNSLRLGGGATLNIIPSLDVGANYLSRESTIPGEGDSRVVSPFAIYRVTPWLQLMPYGTFGVSTRSPNWGTGLAIQLTQSIE
jgi:hypothetical protein